MVSCHFSAAPSFILVASDRHCTMLGFICGAFFGRNFSPAKFHLGKMSLEAFPQMMFCKECKCFRIYNYVLYFYFTHKYNPSFLPIKSQILECGILDRTITCKTPHDKLAKSEICGHGYFDNLCFFVAILPTLYGFKRILRKKEEERNAVDKLIPPVLFGQCPYPKGMVSPKYSVWLFS